MTPEQRKQLAENLKKKMASAPEDEGTGKGPSKKQLRIWPTSSTRPKASSSSRTS